MQLTSARKYQLALTEQPGLQRLLVSVFRVIQTVEPVKLKQQGVRAALMDSGLMVRRVQHVMLLV